MPYENLGKCIDWFDCQKNLPQNQPPIISVLYRFKWKDNVFGKSYKELEIINIGDFDTPKKENDIHILLSKTNYTYFKLIFPFEKVCDEFFAVCDKIMKMLPIELKDKDFHTWKPTKNNDNYIIRKMQK